MIAVIHLEALTSEQSRTLRNWLSEVPEEDPEPVE